MKEKESQNRRRAQRPRRKVDYRGRLGTFKLAVEDPRETDFACNSERLGKKEVRGMLRLAAL